MVACERGDFQTHHTLFIKINLHPGLFIFKTNWTLCQTFISFIAFWSFPTGKNIRNCEIILKFIVSQTTFTPEQRFPDSWMFLNSSHSVYWDSQGVYTTGEFGFVGIRIQCFHFKFRTQKFPDSWRNRKVFIPNSCFVCKRQMNPGAKRSESVTFALV